MNMNQYQDDALKTAIYPSAAIDGLLYTVLGLTGEAGEIANKVKKIYRDDNGSLSHEMRLSLAKELGDCLWYIAATARELDLKLGQIAFNNVEMLNSRAQRGTLSGSGDNR